MDPSTRTAPLYWSVLTSAYVYGWAAWYGAILLAGMVYKQLTTPSKWLFGYKRRSTPPRCLQDPALGQHGYVTVQGLKFHYVGKGDRSKPLMLFVHGFPEFWYSWRHQMREFSNDYWTVAVDMRGYGDSAKPSSVFDYSMVYLIDDIKGIVTELGRKKFILVSHDWGAVISWAFLEKYPEMVDKYVIMNGANSKVYMQLSKSPSSDQSKKSWYIYLVQMPYLGELFVSFGDMAIFRNIFFSHRKSSPFVTEDDIEAYKYTFSQPGALTPPLNYYRASMLTVIRKGIVRPPLRKDIEKVERPKGLYIFGADDLYIDVKCVSLLKEQIENLETKIIDGANHFVQQDDPIAVNQAMRSFLG